MPVVEDRLDGLVEPDDPYLHLLDGQFRAPPTRPHAGSPGRPSDPDPAPYPVPETEPRVAESDQTPPPTCLVPPGPVHPEKEASGDVSVGFSDGTPGSAEE